MMINSDAMASLTEANQNFSRIARQVDEKGKVVILKNNSPRYVVLDISRYEQMEKAEFEKLDLVANRILDENMKAMKELAK
ncbi:MAG: type II toxin-antitoxin system Phd/YefM family antitoxin [Christensenella sp.]|uniref:type II toxin-antitoxin system Phd/YefM family antitoxin n=1 Tax=Christensenella sp. TaxID=1935934 RepID=UPI002B1F299D|nr:type II toxin-antitoxin system Phd/YefM family antitoxin [Christensenella sp.]MEA5002040.1 type II toxin-antitoxin system Phd/YefM family antitoxin [Christensenella sp.]